MSEEQNKKSEDRIRSKELEEENSKHFPEDSHAPKQILPSNIELQTSNMEVHKHPHHIMHKKKWIEYFLEFLMIFLAVTLGFFAENIREYYAEKANAKKFLESYRDELLQQQKMYNRYKKIYQNKVVVCDSIKLIFFNGEENKKLTLIERLTIPAAFLVDVPFNTSSYDQMVNSGALRYINNINLRDSMAAYRAQIEVLKNYNSHILQSINDHTFEIGKLEDLHDFISTDTALSYNLTPHIPLMKPFQVLSEEQRRSIVSFYEIYIIQAQSNLRNIRILYSSNQNLLKMVNDQLRQ